jgi:hypothetical protein
VALEDLCWVLNGPALCEAVTGEAWLDYERRRDNHPLTKLQWDRQHQLASYLVGGAR